MFLKKALKCRARLVVGRDQSPGESIGHQFRLRGEDIAHDVDVQLPWSAEVDQFEAGASGHGLESLQRGNVQMLRGRDRP